MPTELSGNHGDNLCMYQWLPLIIANHTDLVVPNEIEDLYILEQNAANNDFSSIPVFPDFHTDSHDPSLYPGKVACADLPYLYLQTGS